MAPLKLPLQILLRLPTSWMLSAAIGRKFLAVAALPILFAAAGCTPKAPDCGDPRVAEAIRESTTVRARALAASFSKWPALLDDDPRLVLPAYFKALRVELDALKQVPEGDTGRNACRATVRMKTAGSQTLNGELAYTTAGSREQPAGFEVQVPQLDSYASAVAIDLQAYYSARRIAGTWQGILRCSGVEGAADGPAGPFEEDVTMQVDASSNAVLERRAIGGVTETLKGEMGPSVKLVGGGSDNAGARWETRLQGELRGEKLSARGVTTADRKVLRGCAIELSRKAG